MDNITKTWAYRNADFIRALMLWEQDRPNSFNALWNLTMSKYGENQPKPAMVQEPAQIINFGERGEL
ncbi:hypothetical protein [Desulfotignum balticum]|uniref:hypothetical protein n=1 Tax=Desulfotignum balticum TaxID=115781 RepID=UPI0004104725|nr:hypothetical protein [Desulfotignum balticum]